MKWTVGDKAMAKWPGSALYFHSEITAVNDNDSADVLFKDGTEMEIPLKYIKPESTFAQKRRSKSPARTRRRSRSPARSPARKSQVRKGDETPTTRRSSSRSRGKVSFSPDTKKSKSDDQKTQVTSEKSVTTTKITRSLVEIGSPGAKPTHQRHMTTRQMKVEVSSSPGVQRHRKVSLEVQEAYPAQNGGTLGVFMTYLIAPIVPLLLLLTCTERDCSITKFKVSMVPVKWQAYFSVRSFVVLLSFMIFQAIIYALPFGHVIKGPRAPNGKRLDYRISAPYTLIITGATYAVAVYRYKISFAFIHDELFRLAVAALVVSYAATFLLYIASFWAKESDLNPAGNTGSFLCDSFVGRVMNPRIGELFDLKLYFYRTIMTGWLVMIWIEMGRDYNMHGTHSVQFLIVALSQIVYIFFAYFYDEAQSPYTFDVKDFGLGFVQIYGELVFVPFLYTIPVRYVMYFPSELSIPMLVMITTFLLTGYILVFLSGRQKTLFRMDPFDPRVSSYESIPSKSGQRLLVSGLWGFVRHPNYLGEILLGTAFGLSCGFRHFLPWSYLLFVAVLLCHRSLLDEACCLKKHGQAWKTYCGRVKYRVIPGIF